MDHEASMLNVIDANKSPRVVIDNGDPPTHTHKLAAR